jgi:RHS repeat-associated protein
MDLPAGVSTSTYTYAGTAYANPHAPTTIGSTAYAYDNNGNVTSYGTTTVTWDYRNRITRIVGNGATTTYAYDINNERIQIAGNASTTTYPLMLYNVASSTNAKIISKHVFANGEGVADVQGTGASAKAYDIHGDHAGGADIVSNASSTIENEFAYHAYGKARIKKTSANLNEQRQYIGQEYDQATDLNYHHARYYSSTRGQFLSQEPIFLSLGDSGEVKKLSKEDQQSYLRDPQLQNSYSYARDNPIALKDQNGKLVQTALLLARNALIGGATADLGLYASNVPLNLNQGKTGSQVFTNNFSTSDYAEAFGKGAVVGAINPSGVFTTGALVGAVDLVNDFRSGRTPDLKGASIDALTGMAGTKALQQFALTVSSGDVRV